MNRLTSVSKFLALTMLILFTMSSKVVFALGFAQVKLYSYMNEPLDAEIELLVEKKRVEKMRPWQLLINWIFHMLEPGYFYYLE